ncbi:MAG: YkgJ family cysteine cluster protein [Panacagrimonas sp.]
MNVHDDSTAAAGTFTMPTPSCRMHCAACCIAPSISSPIPGMPLGKPAGVRCVQLDERSKCRLFGDPRRPAVCGGLQASVEMCGASREHALHFLSNLEAATRPNPPALA